MYKNKKGQIIFGGIVLLVIGLVVLLVTMSSYPDEINVQVTPLETSTVGDIEVEQSVPQIIGNQPILYTQQYDSAPFFIGELVFSSNQPKWACGTEFIPIVRFESKPECIATEISYAGQTQIIRAGETVRLDRYLEVTYNPQGKFYFNDLGKPYFKDADDWTNEYTFKFTDATFLDVNIQPIGILFPNQDGKMKLTVQNAYTGFVGGIVLTSDRQIISDYVVKEKVFKLSKGATVVSVDVPTDVFGEVNIKVTPFITIGGKNYYSTQSRIGNYLVQPQAVEEQSFLGGLFN